MEYIQDVKICGATMRMRDERSASIYYGSQCEGVLKRILKPRQRAKIIWQNVQRVHGAKKHIYDNDTSARAG